jgi:hypothetical protein
MSVTASHTGRSKAIDADPIAVETIHHRKWIERQDWAFVAQLRAAILSGLETLAGVLGIGPVHLSTQAIRNAQVVGSKVAHKSARPSHGGTLY